MKDFPLSLFRDTAKSIAGGILAFYLGLAGGGIIVFSGLFCNDLASWPLYLNVWLALIPYTIANLWGVLLAPILGTLLFGVIWREWNRFITAASVAILLSTTTLLCSKHNPLHNPAEAKPFMITMGLALTLLILGVAWEIMKRTLTRSPQSPPPLNSPDITRDKSRPNTQSL